MDRGRLHETLYVVFLVYIGLGAVLFYCQVLAGPQMAARAVSVHSRTVGLKEVPRGDILDRNGVALTGRYTAWAVYGWPQLVKSPRQTAQVLGRMLQWNQKQVAVVENRLVQGKKRGEFMVVLKLPATATERERLEKTSVSGVALLPVQRRYDENGFACHLLGEVKSGGGFLDQQTQVSDSSPAHEWFGVSGIEKRYDEVLRRSCREPGDQVAVIVDARGNPIPGLAAKVQRRSEVSHNANVVLTIDQRLQKVVEEVMDRRVSKGAVVVMDVANRDIVAMASRPMFSYYEEAKALRDEADSPFLNRALALYHPGSVFKLVVAAAALDEGVVSVNDTWTCTGSYVFNDKVTIGCWKHEGHGRLRLDEGLAASCNSVFIQVGLKLGRERLLRYVEQLHVTDSQIIGYPGLEQQGYVSVEPGPIALGNASIGQEGVMLSPVQVASLLATIADDGRWTAPRLVRGVRQAGGKWERSFDTLPKERVMSSGTARKLRAMLELAVKDGTGKLAQLEWAGSAGKTASSQTGRFKPDGREVLNTWFAGYLPADSPRWVIVVLVEDGISGGETAAPVFREIADELLKLSPSQSRFHDGFRLSLY